LAGNTLLFSAAGWAGEMIMRERIDLYEDLAEKKNNLQ
jgi:hypothetical protein